MKDSTVDTENVPRLRQFGELRILPALEVGQASIVGLARSNGERIEGSIRLRVGSDRRCDK